jgi:RHS repeat-associated protein
MFFLRQGHCLWYLPQYSFDRNVPLAYIAFGFCVLGVFMRLVIRCLLITLFCWMMPSFISAQTIVSASISPSSVITASVISSNATLTVTITRPPGTENENIGVQAHSAITGSGASFTIPPGVLTASGLFTATAVGTQVNDTITVTVGGGTDSKDIPVTLLPNIPTATFSSTSISGDGGSTIVNVSLLAPLPDYSLTVVLSYSPNPPAANGGPCYIPAGGSTASCAVYGYAVTAPTTVTFTPYLNLGSYNGNPTGSPTIITVYPQLLNPAGPCPDCNGQVGHPINLTTGDTWITQQDYFIPGLGNGLSLARTWNSLWQVSSPVQITGMFGNSWRSTYEERLQVLDSTHMFYWRDDGSSWIMVSPSPGAAYSVASPQTQHATLSVSGSVYTLQFMDGSQHLFNLSGFLTTLIDRNGNHTNVTYDANGRISQIEDAGSRILTFHYNATSTQVENVTDSTGTIASYTYANFCPSSGCSTFLSQAAYPDGSQSNFTYDTSSGMILSVTDASSKVIETHTYDGYYRGLTSQRANGVDLVTVSYPSAATAQVTSSVGYTTAYTFSTAGGASVVTNVSGPTCSTCEAGNTSSFTFDASGNRLTSTDANGDTTSFTYDLMGNMLSRSNNVNGTQLTWTYAYDSFGDVLTQTDPLNHTTTNTYDSKGNLLTTTTPAPGGSAPASETIYTYDAQGNLKTITDPLSNKTKIAYFSTGLISSITDAKLNVTSFTYDGRGNRLTVKDPLGKITTSAYDAMNRVTKITYTDSSTTQFGYDNRGRRISVTDGNNNVTKYVYDDADRLTTVTDAAANTTAYGYDTESDLTSIIDASLRETLFTYDDLRRVSKTTFPSNLVETYGYDNVGNLTSKTDRKNQTTTYAYDQINRLTKKTYPDSTSVAYTYDNANHLTEVSDPTGTYQSTLDNMGRLSGTVTNYSFLTSRAFDVSYGYDLASNRTSLTDAENGGYTYTYDQLNRLTGLTPPSAFATGLFGFTYDALSRRTQLTRPNGVNTNYTYDSLSRLLKVLHQKGSTILDGATYTVDPVGNRKTREANPANTTFTYSYDLIYELTKAVQSSTTKESYSYDPVGNRLSALNSVGWSYNASNQLTSRPGVTYTYDSNGNTLTEVTSAGTTTFAWDFENRLSSVTLPGAGGTINFKYDPFGRRIYKSTVSGVSIYVYDGNDLVEEVNSTGGVVARYVYGPKLDEPLAMLRSSATSYYHQDAVGSVSSLSNASGAVAETYTFDSFGNQTGISGSLTNPFRFTGRELDTETGLYFYRARYYDSAAGRFTGEDPIRFWSGSDFYEYVRNNPTRFRDPSGLQPPNDPKEPRDPLDHIPGVNWIRCRIWGYYCLQQVFEKKQEELANPSPASDQDLAGNGLSLDAGKRAIEICAKNDENCKKFLKKCGEEILAPVKDGMFPGDLLSALGALSGTE